MITDEKEIAKYKNRFGVIYCIEDLENGKLYIGQTRNIRQRIRQYRYESKHYNKRTENRKIFNALYYKDFSRFKFSILEACDSLDELNERESFWINRLDTTDNSIGYNSSTGGEAYAGKRCRPKSRDELNNMHIPVIAYKAGRYLLFPSAKSLGDYISLPRTNITRAAKKAIRVRGYYVFYYDNALCIESIETIQKNLIKGKYSKRSDKETKTDYIDCAMNLINGNVEIIRKCTVKRV